MAENSYFPCIASVDGLFQPINYLNSYYLCLSFWLKMRTADLSLSAQHLVAIQRVCTGPFLEEKKEDESYEPGSTPVTLPYIISFNYDNELAKWVSYLHFVNEKTKVTKLVCSPAQDPIPAFDSRTENVESSPLLFHDTI